MRTHRADALKAVDEAFSEGVKHLYTVLVQGIADDKPRESVLRFKNGLDLHCDAHRKAMAAIGIYFEELKP